MTFWAVHGLHITATITSLEFPNSTQNWNWYVYKNLIWVKISNLAMCELCLISGGDQLPLACDPPFDIFDSRSQPWLNWNLLLSSLFSLRLTLACEPDTLRKLAAQVLQRPTQEQGSTPAAASCHSGWVPSPREGTWQARNLELEREKRSVGTLDPHWSWCRSVFQLWSRRVFGQRSSIVAPSFIICFSFNWRAFFSCMVKLLQRTRPELPGPIWVWREALRLASFLISRAPHILKYYFIYTELKPVDCFL